MAPRASWKGYLQADSFPREQPQGIGPPYLGSNQ